MITKADIEKLAKLSRLKLTEAEKETYLRDMESILAYVAVINAAQPSVAKAMEGAVKNVPINVMRLDDHPHDAGVFTDALIALAPRSEGNRVKVKKIL